MVEARDSYFTENVTNRSTGGAGFGLGVAGLKKTAATGDRATISLMCNNEGKFQIKKASNKLDLDLSNAEVKALFQKWRPLVYKTFLPSVYAYPVEFFVTFKNQADRHAAFQVKTGDLFEEKEMSSISFANIEKIVEARCSGNALLFRRVDFQLPSGYSVIALRDGWNQVNGKLQSDWLKLSGFSTKGSKLEG